MRNFFESARFFGVTGAILLVAGFIIAGTTAYESKLIVRSSTSNPTCASSSGDGYICAEDGIESEGILNVAGNATITGTLTQTGAVGFTADITASGGAGALTFSGSAASIVADDNDSTALLLGSTGRLDLLTIDTSNGAEEVTVKGEFHRSPAYSVAFDAGAAKGLALRKPDGTAFAVTVDLLMQAYYGEYMFNIAHETTGTGVTMAMEADGLDVAQGMGNTDVFEMWGGTFGAVGRPIEVGNSGAVKFCANIDVTTVAGETEMWIGFRTVEVVDAYASYTDFAVLGMKAGDFYVADTTTGETDAGGTAGPGSDWADGENYDLCVHMSAAGVITYSVDTVTPDPTDAHTIGDGLLVVPFFQHESSATPAADVFITSWAVTYEG